MSHRQFPLTDEALELALVTLARLMVARIRTAAPDLRSLGKPNVLDPSRCDWLTNVDLEVQRCTIDWLRGMFPGAGMLGEEKGGRITSERADTDLVCVIDPVDGTKQLVFGNLEGVAWMVAFVADRRVQAAAIARVGSGDVVVTVGHHPVRHYRADGSAIELERRVPHPAQSYLIADQSPAEFGSSSQRLAIPKKDGGFFHGLYVFHGGIGALLPTLWLGERAAGAFRLGAHVDHPWDVLAIAAISERLGYETFTVDETSSQLIRRQFAVTLNSVPRPNAVLFLHPEHVVALESWFGSRQ